MPTFKFAAAALAFGLIVAAPAAAEVIHDEGADGDLSNDRLAPTELTFGLGSNDVLGTTGRSEAGIDRDYFTFTIAPGQVLTAIEVLPGTTSLNELSFIGLQAGVQVTVAPDAGSAAGLLGWWHFSPADIGTDILDNIGIPAAGSAGFTPPLGPGAYSVWIQEANVGTSNYAFRFEVAVPEPGAVGLLGLGVLALAGARRRRTR